MSPSPDLVSVPPFLRYLQLETLYFWVTFHMLPNHLVFVTWFLRELMSTSSRSGIRSGKLSGTKGLPWNFIPSIKWIVIIIFTSIGFITPKNCWVVLRYEDILASTSFLCNSRKTCSSQGNILPTHPEKNNLSVFFEYLSYLLHYNHKVVCRNNTILANRSHVSHVGQALNKSRLVVALSTSHPLK